MRGLGFEFGAQGLKFRVYGLAPVGQGFGARVQDVPLVSIVVPFYG